MGDGQRTVAFMCAALALLLLTILLAVREPGRTTQSDTQPPISTTAIRTGRPPSKPSAMQRPASASPYSVSRSRSPSAGGARPGEREASSAPAVDPYTAARAERAARAFLVGYLSYSYGRAAVQRIRAAAGRLIGDLKRTPPRVPAAVTRADPRLISVRAEAALGDHAIGVVAVVDDGQRRYSVPLELRETGGDCSVTAIGG